MTKAILTLCLAAASLAATCQNPMSQGRWHRIGIASDGIYRISYKKLKSLGFQSPESVRIFGNGTGMLPVSATDPRPETLSECKVLPRGEYIYFYASGPSPQQYSKAHGMNISVQNIYTPLSGYFISDSPTQYSNQMQQAECQQPTGEQQQGIFSYHHELMLNNIQGSGQRWLGERISPSKSETIEFSLNSAPLSAKIAAAVASRSSQDESVTIKAAGQQKSIYLEANSGSGPYASSGLATISIPAQNSSKIEVEAAFSHNSPMAAAYIDYISAQTAEKLIYNGKQLIFRTQPSSHDFTRFRFQNIGPGHIVLDVTDYGGTYIIQPSEGQFVAPTPGERRLAVCAPDDAWEPEFLGEVPNQNLRIVSNIEYLIICPEWLLEQARRIADLHPSLKCLAVTDQQIYNEFSSGMRDPAAIRDFARHILSSGHSLKYMLLLGDGSFDNFHDTKGNTNVLPTYQSANSFNENGERSFVTDDFFAMLESGGECEGPLSIGVGRLPASTEQEADDAISKIAAYISQGPADFAKRIVMVADDGDNGLHAMQSESIALDLEHNHPEFDITKIYLDSYRMESTAASNTYPEARSQLLGCFSQGAMAINYTGHGGMRFFADEMVLTIEDIENMDNSPRLPIVISSSCNIGHFDSYSTATSESERSPAEILALSSRGGAIASIAAARESLSNGNFALNSSIMQQIAVPGMRLGDIMREAKNQTADRNMLNYILLGDPALKLRVPEYSIEAVRINGIPIEQFSDTLKAMATYTLECETSSKELFAQGTASIAIYDKERIATTLGNLGSSPIEFSDYGNTIFKGKSPLKEGGASFAFTVPKDICYEPGPIKISLYAQNGSSSASGCCKSLMLGGSANTAGDGEGPSISASFYAESSKGRMLRISVSDPSGINITATPGHQITITDIESGICRDVTALYNPDMGSPTSGSIDIGADYFGNGIHTISIKAWDNMNNPSSMEIRIAATSDPGLSIYSLRAWPNPCSRSADIDFALNSQDGPLQYTIALSSIAGQQAWTASGTIESGAPRIHLDWPEHLSSGPYALRLTITDSSGRTAQSSIRLIHIK